MIRLKLTEQELSDIAELIDDPSTGEQYKRKLLVLRMHSEGAKHGFIAKVMNLHSNTITNYVKEYAEGGIGATIEDRYYRPSSSLEPFMQCIQCAFRVAPPADAKQAAVRIEAMSGVRLSESQIRRFMKKIGMKLRKAASIPAKADPQLQFDFYTNEMVPRLQQAASGQRKVFFVDAAHFVLGAFLGMVWCFCRVFVKTSPGRQRYNVLGAIDSNNHELISIRTTGSINSQTVIELMEKIRQKHPTSSVTLVMDNARYQRNKQVMEQAVSRDIELLFLPPYSPNLNLIERLWKLTKKRCLTNRYYPDFQAFRKGIDKCLDQLTIVKKHELDSIMKLNFQLF